MKNPPSMIEHETPSAQELPIPELPTGLPEYLIPLYAAIVRITTGVDLIVVSFNDLGLMAKNHPSAVVKDLNTLIDGGFIGAQQLFEIQIINDIVTRPGRDSVILWNPLKAIA
jgi:hypothetical protein